MKIVREETIQRVREVLGGSPGRAWGPVKLPPVRIAFVPFTLAEVEILPDDRSRPPCSSRTAECRARLLPIPSGQRRLCRQLTSRSRRAG